MYRVAGASTELDCDVVLPESVKEIIIGCVSTLGFIHLRFYN